MKRFLIKAIRWYQRHISANTPPTCRHYPTCSNYAIEALEIHGAIVGTLLTIKRILKCNPCFKSSVDLVPPKRRKKGID
jgi:putative membrane protein insertion efficiency factor